MIELYKSFDQSKKIQEYISRRKKKIYNILKLGVTVKSSP